VLADGMGGYNAGEVASGMATSFIKSELGRWLQEASGNATDIDVRRAMDICVDNANRAIFNAANSNPQYAGMGTTLVVAAFRGDLYLMCSDGLSDMLDDETIAQVLTSNDSLEEAGAALIDAANDAGGKDNIAVILVRQRSGNTAPARSWWPFKR